MAKKVVKLSITDRMAVLAILPKEGNYTDLLLLREVKEVLSFSEEENELLKFTPLPNGMVKWSKEGQMKIGYKRLCIPEATASIIVKVLNDLDKKGKLDESLLGIYKIFVFDKDEPVVDDGEEDEDD